MVEHHQFCTSGNYHGNCKLVWQATRGSHLKVEIKCPLVITIGEVGLDNGIPKKYILRMNQSKQVCGERRLPMRGIKGHELCGKEDIVGISSGDNEGMELKKRLER